jgi:hypothetical protein
MIHSNEKHQSNNPSVTSVLRNICKALKRNVKVAIKKSFNEGNGCSAESSAVGQCWSYGRILS